MGLCIRDESASVPDYYKQKREAEKQLGRELSHDEFKRSFLHVSERSSLSGGGTSVFDPCVCEMDYTWYTAAGDEILDPFAGGSVRGIVAHQLGRTYTGIELRPEQVDANRIQAAEIIGDNPPEWICGDSANMDALIGGRTFDHIMTCPPYGDLERYSDDPADISNMDDDEFDVTYRNIIAKSVERLRDNRFATVVVGNYRDRKGYLRDLSGITIRAMEDAGARYYNDQILVTPAGSLPIRTRKQFESSRKIGRRHQYVLTFVKGDPRKATERIGSVQLSGLDLSGVQKRTYSFPETANDVTEYLDAQQDAAGAIVASIRAYIS